MKCWIKNLIFYILGIITPIIIVILIDTPNQSDSKTGLTMFKEPADCISKKEFQIFQVLDSNIALASELSFSNSAGKVYNGTTVLFITTEGKYYYDEQVIKIPNKKCAKQVGIYEYKTKSGDYKTVPAVTIDY